MYMYKIKTTIIHNVIFDLLQYMYLYVYNWILQHL